MTAPLHDAIPEVALAWHRAGRGAALATVIETWGSAPRPVGAQLAVDGAGEIMGSVSGGCVEGAVVVEAEEALADGRPRLLEFGVSDADAFAVGLACGGTIRVMVEPVGVGDGLPAETLQRVVEGRAAREPVALVTDTLKWERRVAGAADYPERFRLDRSGFDAAAPERFVAVHNPPLRLVVVGAVHIAQPLVQIARLAGYDVTVIDPRESFATAERFPGEVLRQDWPDEALAAHGIDARTAVAVLTHDPKIDDPAIEAALRSDCFYLGALGSTRTHAKRVARLTQAGFDAGAIERIDAPIGLDLGARSPAEIAIAIMAAMTAALRRPGG